MLSFSVIIVSWNAIGHLKTFMPSVAETTYRPLEIILADNASTDGSAEWVRNNFPDVKIVTMDKNYGYCGGNNRAAKAATGDILLFLNNDVKVEPGWIEPLARVFQQEPDVAVVQPKIRSYTQPDYFEYAGAAGGFIDRYGFPFCRGRIFDTLEKDEGQYDQSTEIFWASGAALAVRREDFEAVGGFDEDFEFHMEEIDLCWRLWNRGRKVMFCAESVVYHLGGGSLPMDSPRKTYYNYRNNLTMLWKNYSGKSLRRHFPIRLMLDGTALLQALITLKFPVARSILKAHLHFWKSLSSTRRKRENVHKERNGRKEAAPIKPISIVWEYFVKGKKTYSSLFD